MSITGNMSVTQLENRVRHPRDVSDPRIAFFDHHAPTWDDDGDDAARTLARLDEMKDRLGLCAGQDVLEVGCGTGRITGWLGQAIYPGRVTAVDFSPAMLEQAKKRNLSVEFRLVDMCGGIQMEDLFDVVFCFNAFPHFRDQSMALSNIRRLLKRDGQLIILHLAGSLELNDFHSRLSHPVCHDHLPSSERWPGLLDQANLSLLGLTDEPGLFLLKASVKK
jgi:SAM-dependent methyltransferase